MIKMYRVQAPDRYAVSVAGLGNFSHGMEIRLDDKLANMFPSIFIEKIDPMKQLFDKGEEENQDAVFIPHKEETEVLETPEKVATLESMDNKEIKVLEADEKTETPLETPEKVATLESTGKKPGRPAKVKENE